MPVLILLGIGAIYGVAGLIDRYTPPKPPSKTSDERTRQVFANNQKRIDKIMRKYR